VITNAIGFTATYTATGKLGAFTCTLSGTVNGTRR